MVNPRKNFQLVHESKLTECEKRNRIKIRYANILKLRKNVEITQQCSDLRSVTMLF